MDLKQYKTDYDKKNYDFIGLKLPKGKKEVLQAAAAARRLSLSAAIVAAVEWYYNIDISSKEQNQ